MLSSKMIKVFRLILPAMVLIVLNGMSVAALAQDDRQAGRRDIQPEPADSFLLRLPPLETLIDSAIARAPLMKAQELDLRRSKLEIDKYRRSWTKDIISGGANLNYGRFDNLIIAKDLGLDQLNTNTSEQTRYSVGLSLKFPISALYDKYDLNNAKINREQVEVGKEILVKSIREEVYSRYNALLSSYEKYILLVEHFDAHDIILQNAEKNFLSNRIRVEELTLLKMEANQAKIDLITAKNDFFKARWMLEELTGIPIR